MNPERHLWLKVPIGVVMALVLIIAVRIHPIFWLCVIPIGAYFVMGFRWVQVDERGYKVFMQMPRSPVDSGLRFVWLFLEDIIIVTKNRIVLDFAEHQVMTKPDPSKTGGAIGPVEISVDSTLAFYWPADDNLKDAIEKLPREVLYDNAAATRYFAQFVQAAIRDASGKKSWVEIVANREEFNKAALKHLKSVSKLSELGLRSDFVFDIKDVDLTDEMKQALNRQEKARMDRQAAEHEGEAAKIKIVKEGEGESKVIEIKGAADAGAQEKMGRAEAVVIGVKGTAEADARERMGLAEADAREKMLATVKAAGADLEVLYTLREMAQGTSNTILYQIPQQLYDRIGTLLGGNTPEQALRTLFPAATEAFIKNVVEKAKAGGMIS